MMPQPEDPLRYSFPLPIAETYFPMGLPVRVKTNSRVVVEAAAEGWGWSTPGYDVPPVELQLAVLDRPATHPPAPALPYGRGNLLAIVHSAEDFAVADFARGFAFGWLTPGMAADRGYLRYHFLDPLAYLLLGSLYLAPVHAACVALEGAGVLLCGDSGSGKTSLAYALARRGWTYVADDASHLWRGDAGRRILGRPHQIRFRSSAQSLFPELARFPAVRRPNGKLDLEISTADLGLPSTAGETRADCLVFLRRDGGSAARLRPYPWDQTAAWLDQVLCWGEESMRREQRRCLSRLRECPIVELTYSDAAGADEQLRTLLRSQR